MSQLETSTTFLQSHRGQKGAYYGTEHNNTEQR